MELSAGASSPIPRQHSMSRSVVSMKNWQERQLTIQDIEDFIDLKETHDKDEYTVIHNKLKTHLDAYNGPNPFIYVLPFTWYEKFKIFLFTITGILLIKAVLSVLFIFFAYIVSVIKNCCYKNKFSPILSLVNRGLIRIILFVSFGIYWIPVKYGNKKKLKEWPRIITPNHVSLLDGFLLYYVCGTVFVAKKEIQSIPMLGTIMTAMHCVFVDRSSKKARKEVINVIKQHAANPDNPPLCIFPQGTCTNTLTMTQFKCGAFIPGVPVLPTAIHYTNCFCDMVLLGGILMECAHAMSQFINFAKIEFLDAYEPSEQEQQDAVLYASNVRKLLAEALDADMTPHTFDDFLLSAFADNLKQQHENKAFNMIEIAPFIMGDVHRKLKMKAKTVIELGKVYMRYCDDNGRISLDTFCNVFHIDDERMAKILFELFIGERNSNDMKIVMDSEEKQEMNPNDNNKFILFDDFLVGVAICFQEDHVDDALTLFYLCMDEEGHGSIEPHHVLRFVKKIENSTNKTFDGDMNGFCLMIFDIEQIENCDKQLRFQQFKENVMFHSQTELVQDFLQFIIFEFLHIKLDESMVVVAIK